MRTSNNNEAVFFKNANLQTHLFKLNLSNPSNTFNQIAVGCTNGATNGIDNQIDAVLFDDSETTISTLIDNVDDVIQGRSFPFSNSNVVPMGFKTNVSGNYSISSKAFKAVLFKQPKQLSEKKFYSNHTQY